ncbi:hypothetical protein BDU57DRAFT_512489 [Ampelomyces quisqualis]|uniref:Uncharacterized protein n=1 Tax=Ampelomyces quisqualis TaxID=50730 RepID=A0A6A5QXP5_AMPQU|nr:hypothetical protein BDU57DRAFT_512489 [Ampelomyces quisqualis]
MKSHILLVAVLASTALAAPRAQCASHASTAHAAGPTSAAAKVCTKICGGADLVCAPGWRAEDLGGCWACCKGQ